MAAVLASLAMKLVRPALTYLDSYVAALKRDWSPDNMRGVAAAHDELREIDHDAGEFVRSLTDPEAEGPPITLPDGSRLPRLPGFRLWMWDGEFCGSIGLRWQPGTTELPSYCLVTSVTPSYPGDSGVDTPLVHSVSCCRWPGNSGWPTSISRQTLTISHPSVS